jgi:hypothetical protein
MRIRRILLAAILGSLLVGSASAGAYTAEITPFDEEFEQQQAKKAVEQREREVAQANAQKAAEERAQAEAAEQPARERAEVEARLRHENETAEREMSEREARMRAVCHVPALRGHSVAGARALLRRSDCALGALHVRHGRHGSLIVVGQSVAAGAHRPAGSRVAITAARR